uniref:Hexamerin-like protein 5 n=1 Tax=Tetrix subulata TaxID=288127 RepID=A0A2I6SDD6_9ORTH|nr:hexamerin-like protein 5 [Tetrix subulata]
MRYLVAAVVLLAALAAAKITPITEVNAEFLAKQRDVLRILWYYDQPIMSVEELEMMKNWKIEDNVSHFKDQELLKTFLKWWEHEHFIPRGAPFTLYYIKHMEQTKMIFDVLYSATDYDTFHKTALWMRDHMNQPMFLYAFRAAVLNRPETKGMMLPPAYELTPELFVHADVIQKAMDADMMGMTYKEDPYVIWDNRTVEPLGDDLEEMLAYFREDVGLNNYYTYLALRYPTFMAPANYSHMEHEKLRGEMFFVHLDQLLRRYNTERLALRMTPVEEIDFEEPIETSYYPEIRMLNGKEAIYRPTCAKIGDLTKTKVRDVLNYDMRIREAIDRGYVLDEMLRKRFLNDEEGMTILGSIIEGNGESVNKKLYGSLYEKMLNLVARSFDHRIKDKASQSVLEMIETMRRDPMYYRIIKTILGIPERFKENLPAYTKHDIEETGLKITSVTMDKLITYFDEFEFPLVNVLKASSVQDSMKKKVVVKQQRLNHKPFSYRIAVNSDKDEHIFVRTYMAPRFDHMGREMNFEGLTKYFFLLDWFDTKVHAGENTIERNSKDMKIYTSKVPTFEDLLHRVGDALTNVRPFYKGDESVRHLQFPQRLALPKGSREGMPFKIFVVVTHCSGKMDDSWFVNCWDKKPVTFPIDRKVMDFDLDVPNTHFEDVMVFHRTWDDTVTSVTV